MIPILSGNVASALGGAYEVANSCRFNDGDSASMSKSSSSGDRRQFTISAWVKRGVLGTEQQIYGLDKIQVMYQDCFLMVLPIG